MKTSPLPTDRIERSILIVRGHKVMLDAALAALYGVETRALVQAVKRNPERFPKDFMFQMTDQELTHWRSQIVMSISGARMGLRRPPYAFTEHGALMAATVLNSRRKQKLGRTQFRLSTMPRIARPVFPNIPHHITQRGNRRENVFFTDGDRVAYLGWLAQYCAKHEIRVLAYCLMTNHVHLVAIPETEDAFEKAFRPLHTRYAQRINRARKWSGHLWQGRFFSSALDDRYLWAAIRYVERNPVRAGMVRRAEDYRWSSALAHCEGKDDYVLTRNQSWLGQLPCIDDWSRWLAEPDQWEQINVLRQRVERGLPCGSEDFVQGLELQAGKELRPTAVGRPKKSEIAPAA